MALTPTLAQSQWVSHRLALPLFHTAHVQRTGRILRKGSCKKNQTLTSDFITGKHSQPLLPQSPKRAPPTPTPPPTLSESKPKVYPGSSSLSTRSRGRSFPRDVWSLLAFSPPPGLADTEKQHVKLNVATPWGDCLKLEETLLFATNRLQNVLTVKSNLSLQFSILKSRAGGWAVSQEQAKKKNPPWQWWMY